MKEELIKRFGLQTVGAESTDIEVLDKLEEHFKSLKDDKEKGEEKAVEATVNAAVKAGKILASARQTYLQIGKTSGLESLNAVFETIPTAKAPVIHSLASHIKPEAATHPLDDDIRHNVGKWGLDEYRKYNPKALRDNPSLYDELYKKEYGQNK